MFEIFGGILGGALGGIFRLAPEVLKFFDKKNERLHEMAMFSRQCELEQIRGQMKLAEIGAQREAAVDVGVMDAFNAAINQQAEMVKAAGGWYWILLIWSLAHFWYAWTGYRTGLDPTEVFKLFMSPDFSALLAGTINYWFLDRTLKQRGI